MSRQTTDHPSAIDIHIGLIIRARRLALGMTQQELSEPLGLSWQQVWKYENGTNRVAASRLFEIAILLRLPPGEFYQGLDPATGEPAGPGELADFFATKGAFELARAYMRLAPHQRARLVDLAEVIVPNTGHDGQDLRPPAHSRS